MTELSNRLRNYRVSAPTEHPVNPVICNEAAAEIERLGEELKRFGPGYWAVVDERNRLERGKAILDERDRQDARWGPQDHLLPTWLAILMEEVGELAAACLCHKFGSDDHPELDWRKEAIQVAAVALSMVEQYKAEDNATE